MNDPFSIADLMILADDPDDTIWNSVKIRLEELAQGELNALYDLWNKSTTPLQADRIESLIWELQINNQLKSFQAFCDSSKGLKEGILEITRIISYEFSMDNLNSLLDPIVKEVWIELSEKLTALEKIRIMNHLLFEKKGLKSKSNLEARSIHLYLPTLLKTKIGHPLALTTLFCLLGRALELPIYKVGKGDLPAIAYLDLPKYKLLSETQISNSPVLFYILISDQLEVFGKKQFTEYVHHLYPTGNHNIQTVGDRDLIHSILYKLKFLYQEENNGVRKNQVDQLISILNNC